jgi:hypothetical protein
MTQKLIAVLALVYFYLLIRDVVYFEKVFKTNEAGNRSALFLSDSPDNSPSNALRQSLITKPVEYDRAFVEEKILN